MTSGRGIRTQALAHAMRTCTRMHSSAHVNLVVMFSVLNPQLHAFAPLNA